MINIILGVIILILIVERVCTQRQHASMVNKLCDKIMSRNYTEYKIGQDIKADELTEAIPARTDEEEAKIEEDRNKGLVKTAHILGSDIENLGL